MAGGCAIRGLPATDGVVCPECPGTVCPGRQTLEIEYLGSGGYRLTRGDDTILLGPFFSNPGPLKAASLRRMAPDVAALQRWLPDVSKADAILVGHAHYDHLLDVPWIAEHRARRARIYGSRTAAHLLAAVPALNGRVIAIESAYSAHAPAASGTEPGPKPWIRIPGTRVRFLPIESEHAPHFAGIRLMRGRLTEDRQTLPTRARGWVEGQTYAFLFEFLHPTDDGRVLFSVHYQDTASTPPLGFPPDARRPLDAALVCVASHRGVRGYPDALLAHARPRHVVLGHWENFFAPYTRDPARLRGVPFSHPRDFMARVQRYAAGQADASWLLPAPGTVLELVACP